MVYVRDLLTRLRSSDGVRARLARGTLWSTAGTLGQQICAMLASIVAARLLGTAQFGEFGLVRSTIVMFGVLAGSGLGLATTKAVAEYRSNDPVRAGRIIALLLNGALVGSGLAFALCLFLAPWLAATAMGAPELVTALRLASVLLLINALGAVQNGVLVGLEVFKPFFTLLVVEGVLTLIGIAGGTALGGLNGGVLGSAIGPTIVVVLKHRLMLSQCAQFGIPISRGGAIVELPVIWSAFVPAVLIGVSSQPFEWLGRLLLARGSGGYEAVGIFTAAYPWGQIVSFAAAQLITPAIPVMANVFAGRDDQGFRSLLRMVGLATLAVTIVFVVPMIVLSGSIMRTYGHGFSGGGPVLIAMAVAYGISSLSSLFRSALVATGRLWTQNLHAMIWGTALVGGFLLFRHLGALGLALAYVVAYSVVVVTQGASVWRLVHRHADAEVTA